MTSPPILFDAVVFDLDGTLVATDRFWVDAARVGARRAFEELGLDAPMPSAEQWMSVVGLPLAQGFDALFKTLPPKARALVLARCVEEEGRALRAGHAALLPGVEATLGELRARGVKLGIASNCGQGYLDTMLHELGLARWVEEARCLDSAGVHSKGGMVADLLQTFDTRAAVVVGDRLGDRDAAWENGLPHVHLARGFARFANGDACGGEEVAAEAVIEEMAELIPRLERRARWIEGLLGELGMLTPSGPRSLGITGHSGSGKSLFARDVARILGARGRAAAVVALDDFLKVQSAHVDLTATTFWPVNKPMDHLAHGFELEELVTRVLQPHARGEDVDYERAVRAPDTSDPVTPDATAGATAPANTRVRIHVPKDAVLVLQGLFLLHPSVRELLERVMHLEVSENQSLRRVAGRDARVHGPESLMRVRRHFLPTQRAFDELIDPKIHADRVVDAENALGP